MKARTRRSRMLMRATLIAVTTALSATLAAPLPARAHAFVSSSANVPVSTVTPVAEHHAHFPVRVRPGLPPAAHAAKLIANVPQFDGIASATAVTGGFAILVLALGIALTLRGRGWQLEFAGQSSRTRGQPLSGALAL